MGTFEKAFKEEVFRLARKEIKRSASAIQASLIRQNKELNNLKKRMKALDGKPVGSVSQPKPSPPAVHRLRITPKGVQALRTKHRLSQSELGKLLGVSQNTIYHWEAGKTKPRVSHMARIDQLRSLGKKDLKRKLELLESG